MRGFGPGFLCLGKESLYPGSEREQAGSLDSWAWGGRRPEAQTGGFWGGGLSLIPRMERITLGDTSSGPNSERPTWHSYSASSLRSHASMWRWNSPVGKTKVKATASRSGLGSQTLTSHLWQDLLPCGTLGSLESEGQGLEAARPWPTVPHCQGL
jgi:hypothetical protein